jgi:hypothetical protein
MPFRATGKDMEYDTYNTAEIDKASLVMRRLAVILVCVVLFAIFGVAAPYKIYRYLEAKQNANAAVVYHEEL